MKPLLTKLLDVYTVLLLLPWFLVAIGLVVAAFATSLFLERLPEARRWSGRWMVLWVVGGVLAAAGLWLFCTLGPQEKAVAAIKQLKGKVIFDETAPGKPVVRVDIGVDIDYVGNGDDRLGQMAPHLQNLPRLRYLRIDRMAFITDAGLAHLQGLTQLETIEVYGLGITKKGIDNLRQRLPNVKVHHDPWLGIFEMKGDQLKLVAHDPGSPRPKEFVGSMKGLLLITKRAK